MQPRGQRSRENQATRLDAGDAIDLPATGDSFVTGSDDWLGEQQVDIVDMELYAIAQVCRARQVPWRAFKYVTDGADDQAAAEWTRSVGGEALFAQALARLLSPSQPM